MRTAIFLAIILLLSSCATLFNMRTDVMKIVTTEPGNIVVFDDTLGSLSTEHYVMLKRSKYEVPFTIYNTENSKSFNVKPGNSITFWGNIYPSMGTGFLIDMNNPKRYSYPHTIYVDMKSEEKGYTTYKPLDTAYTRYDHILKLNPLKAVGLINSGMEISLEKRMNKSFTTQLSGTYLFRNNLMDPREDIDNEIKGFQAGIEPRYYLRKTAPAGPYIALEFSYLKNKYKDYWYFGQDEHLYDSIYTNYPDTFGVNKQTYTLNVKYGYQYVKKRFTVDMYIGMGIRYKDVTHFDKIKPEDPMESPRHPNVYYIMNQQGKYWTLSIPINVRLGWTF